ncbi:MAG: hypothetical protein QM817_13825 [Archangium sp.]
MLAIESGLDGLAAIKSPLARDVGEAHRQLGLAILKIDRRLDEIFRSKKRIFAPQIAPVGQTVATVEAPSSAGDDEQGAV